MERVIICPQCFDTDHCFEEVQEKYSSYLCFSCGFMSDSRYKVGSLELIDNLKKSPKLVQETAYEDKNRNIVWFPSVVNMGDLGIIYPEGTKTNWTYKLAQPRPLTKEEKKDEKYKGHDRMLDVDNAKEFGQYEFLEALKLMGVVKDL